ncbi:hypothetical protein RLIN73S_01946 [Rhodanobacter lindaniclasticus]
MVTLPVALSKWQPSASAGAFGHRCQQLFAEAGGFFQHGIEQVAAVRLAALQRGERGFAIEHVEQGEAQIVEGGLVSGHGVSW